ncbi:TVP38/TMEM64 family protein [Vibrio parahaemolyticus]|uniref:TVP38/TMEM64 family protein n=1 Tax=Vibrio parahaemolyticus TaxID=670 RepID=UPI0035BEF418
MKWLKLALLILAGVLLANQLDNPVLSHLTDRNWLVGYIQKNGALGHVVIFTFSVVFLSLSGPKQAIALVFGYLYHVQLGVLITLFACVFGATFNYACARFLIGNWLYRRFPKKMTRFNSFASRKPFYKILLLRLFPIGNNVVTASLLGYLPQIIIFALMGAGIHSSSNTMIYLSIFFGIVSAVLTGFLYRDHIKSRVELLNMEEEV